MLAEHVKAHIVSDALEQEPYRPNRLTASMITACDRLTWYDAHGHVEKDSLPSANSLERTSDGHWHQEKFTQRLRAMSNVDVLREEFTVWLGKASARIDIRIRWREQEWNIEYKSLSTHTFLPFVTVGVQAFPYYWAQCQTILGADPATPLIFYAKNVENGDQADVQVYPDEEFIEEIRQRGTEFQRFLLLNQPPPRPYEINDQRCVGCTARIQCWFPVLRDQVLHGESLTDVERGKITFLLTEMDRRRGAVDEYNVHYDALKGYVELLHSRYERRRIRVKGLNSLMYFRSGEQVDRNYIKALLTEEQAHWAFFRERSIVNRFTLRWEEI